MVPAGEGRLLADPANHILQAAVEGFVSQRPARTGVPADLAEVLFRQRTVQEGIPMCLPNSPLSPLIGYVPPKFNCTNVSLSDHSGPSAAT